MRLFLTILAFLFVAVAQACPFCSSPTAEEIRGSLVQDLPYHLFAIVLPFIVIALIIYAISTYYSANTRSHA